MGSNVTGILLDNGIFYVKTDNGDYREIKPIKRETVQDKVNTEKLTIAIDHVIFSGPATIVFWDDGTKTIVKCSTEDDYSYEVGIAMATLKKIFGDSYNSYRKDVDNVIDEFFERQIKHGN